MTGFNSSEGAGMMPFFVPPIQAGIDKQTAVMIYSKFAGLSVEKCTASLDHGLSYMNSTKTTQLDIVNCYLNLIAMKSLADVSIARLNNRLNSVSISTG